MSTHFLFQQRVRVSFFIVLFCVFLLILFMPGLAKASLASVGSEEHSPTPTAESTQEENTPEAPEMEEEQVAEPAAVEPTPTSSGVDGRAETFSGTDSDTYASPDGSESNDCSTPENACRTISRALNYTAPGGVVYVAIGEYSEYPQIWDSGTISGGWSADFSTQSGYSTWTSGSSTRLVYIPAGDVTLTHFLFTGGYDSIDGGAIYVGSGASLTVINSAFTDNHADGFGGALLVHEGATATLRNVTFSGNTAGNSGGAIGNRGITTLNNVTISENSGTGGGGVYNFNLTGVLTISNTILAGNSSSNDTPNFSGMLTSAGYNLIDDTGAIPFTSTVGDLTDVSVDLDSLTSGFPYYPLLPGNPAVDAGNPDIPGSGSGACEAADQMGTIRPIDTDLDGTARCDIGAIEQVSFVPDTLSVQAGSDQKVLVGQTYAVQLKAFVGFDTNPVEGVEVIFTAPVSGASGTFADSGNHVTSATTGVDGVAIAAMFTANAEAGAFTVSATTAVVTGSADFQLENVVPASVEVQAGSPQETNLSTTFSEALQAIVKDAVGDPLAGVSVTFTAPASDASGTFADSGTNETTAISDAGGIATAADFTANDQEGSYIVNASVVGVATPAEFNLQNRAAEPTTIEIPEITSQATFTDTIFLKPFAVQVLDQYNAPVAGVEVAFTAPASGASGTFADSGTNITTATTGADGVATAAAFAANNIEGVYYIGVATASLNTQFELKNFTYVPVVYFDMVLDESRGLLFGSGGYGGDVLHIFSLDTLEPVGVLEIGARPSGMDISPDGNELAVALAAQNQIAFVDLDTLQITAQVGCQYAYDVIYGRPGRLYCGASTTGPLRVYDTDTKTEIGTSTTFAGANVRLEITADGNTLYVGRASGSPLNIYQFDITTDTPVQSAKGPHGPVRVYTMVLNADESQLYTSKGQAWSADLQTHEGEFSWTGTDVEFLSQQEWIALSDDTEIRFFDATHEFYQILYTEQPGGTVGPIKANAASTTLYASTSEGVVALAVPESYMPTPPPLDPTPSSRYADMVVDDARGVIYGSDYYDGRDKIDIISIDTLQVIDTIELGGYDGASPGQMDLSPDGDFLAVALGGAEKIGVIDLNTRAFVGFGTGFIYPYDVVFGREGRLYASYGFISTRFVVFDTNTFEPINVADVHELQRMIITADHNTIYGSWYSGSPEQIFRIDVSTDAPFESSRVNHGDAIVETIAITPLGTKLFSSRGQVWSSDLSTLLGSFSDGGAYIEYIPGFNWFAVSNASQITVYDADDYSLIGRIAVPDQARMARASADGRHLYVNIEGAIIDYDLIGYYLHLLEGSSQTTQPTFPFPSPLKVQLTDVFGVPIIGETVTFSAPAEGASGTFANTGTNVTTVVTDNNGEAAVQIVANTIEGNFLVTATADDTEQPLQFELEIINTAPEIEIIEPDNFYNANTFLVGYPITFSAVASDFEDDNLNANIIWTSSIDGEIGEGGTISRFDLSIGEHTITAAVADTNGASASDTVMIQIVGSSYWASDNAYLVKDINPAVPDSYIDHIVDLDGTLFFSADDGIHGSELWKSDGTEVGTVLVEDIYPGSASSSPYNLIAVEGIVYFVATDGTHGGELWKSDGTESGTQLVKDIRLGTGSSFVSNLVNIEGTIFFAAGDAAHGSELWKSDGTEAGTVLVKDIYPGSQSSNPAYLINLNGTVFFTAYEPTYRAQLWKTDGTEAGTQLVRAVADSNIIPAISNLTILNDELYFTANANNRSDSQLWKSDGTAAGTELVVDFIQHPVLDSGYSFVAFKDRLYFVGDSDIYGHELWVSDGTPEGTKLFMDLAPGADSFYPYEMIVAGDTLYFLAAAKDLWKSDGTPAGTMLVNPFDHDGYQLNFIDANGFLVFMELVQRQTVSGVVEARTFDLLISDGTPEGLETFFTQTKLFSNYVPDSEFFPNATAGNWLFYGAADVPHGRELWVYEIPLKIGDRVWVDGNGNGVQDSGEPGLEGVTVNLYADDNQDGSPDGGALDSMATDADGHYLFEAAPGHYLIEFVQPQGYTFSPKHNSGDDSSDSDANASGFTDSLDFTQTGLKTRVDAGLIPALVVTKTSTATGPVQVGEEVIFEIEVSNFSEETLTGIQVIDDLDAVFGAGNWVGERIESPTLSINLTYDGSADVNLLDGSDSLAAGESGTIILGVSVNSAGAYTNSAAASGVPVGGGEVGGSDSSSLTVEAFTGPNLIGPANYAVLDTPRPTLTWSVPVWTPESYEVVIEPVGGGTALIDLWVTAANVCGSTECSWAVNAELSEAAYQWKIRSYTAGVGASEFSGTWYFAVDTTIKLNSPVSGETVDFLKPTFTWQKPSWSPQQYNIVVEPYGGGTALINAWVSGATVCSVDECTWTPSSYLEDGSYQWRVQGYTAGFGISSWSTEELFIVAATPTPLDPPIGGTTEYPRPQLTWKQLSWVEWYQLEFVRDGSLPVYRWVEAESVCSAGECVWVTGFTMVDSDYEWRVRGYTPAVATSYWSPTAWFSVQTTPKLTSPANGGTVDDPKPVLAWDALSWAEYYLLEIYDSSLNLTSRWLTAADVCSSGACSYKTPFTLVVDDYTWRVMGYTPGMPVSPWAERSMMLDAAPNLRSPADGETVDRGRPTFSWDALSWADYYEVVIEPAGGGTPLLSAWLEGSSICAGGQCNWPVYITLANGNYQWKVRGYTPAYAAGPYAVPNAITVQTAPQLVSPSDGETVPDRRPILRWDAMSWPTHYQVQVILTGGGANLDRWVEHAVVCSGGTCSWQVDVDLIDGEYSWHVRGYNAGALPTTSAWSQDWLFDVQYVEQTPTPTLTPTPTPTPDCMLYTMEYPTFLGTANGIQLEMRNDNPYDDIFTTIEIDWQFVKDYLEALGYTGVTNDWVKLNFNKIPAGSDIDVSESPTVIEGSFPFFSGQTTIFQADFDWTGEFAEAFEVLDVRLTDFGWYLQLSNGCDFIIIPLERPLETPIPMQIQVP